MKEPTGKLKYAYETIVNMESKITHLKSLLERASYVIVDMGQLDFDEGLIDEIEKETE